MNEAIEVMLKKYNCKTAQDHERALYEIIQQITLLGLWRGKFFEHASFYGGTALRVLYGLDRFSEDLAFSLMKKNMDFSLKKYFNFIEEELNAFGFEVELEKVEKPQTAKIDSAFIKANTMVQFIRIGIPHETQKNKKIQIKFEIDRDPPLGFDVESKLVLEPTPFYVQTYVKEDLFAGKMHALLYRSWGKRIKGRDWYDFEWYIKKNIPIHLAHFQKRAEQSGHLDLKGKVLTPDQLKNFLREKIQNLDVNLAKQDVVNFIVDDQHLNIWSKDFFIQLLDHLKII